MREQDVGEALVVAVGDVVARLQPLDQIGFQQQRFDLGGGRDEDHLRRLRDHARDAIGLRAGLGVGGDPLLEARRLADIEHVALGVQHAIDAGRIGQRLQIGRDALGAFERRLGLALCWARRRADFLPSAHHITVEHLSFKDGVIRLMALHLSAIVRSAILDLHLSACRAAKASEAILIDPVFEQVRRDAALIDELGLKLRYHARNPCPCRSRDGRLAAQAPDGKPHRAIRGERRAKAPTSTSSTATRCRSARGISKCAPRPATRMAA